MEPELVRGVPASSPLGRAAQSIITTWLGLHTPVPERLYHYTRIGGLQGIVETCSFWASHAEYLNDASELRYSSTLIHEIVAEQAARSGSEPVRSLADHPDIVDTFQLGTRPFVTCFCVNGDLLSQWRGYGATAPAYSLGVDLRSLRLSGASQGCVLRRVIYDRDQQVHLVRTAFDAWAAAALTEDVATSTLENAPFPYPAVWVLQLMLVEHFLCFKNPAFREEEEWRLIKLVNVQDELRRAEDLRLKLQLEDLRTQFGQGVPELPSFPTRAESLEIRFRPSSFGFVPYIALPINDFAGVFANRLPLWEVVHGPTAHPELALASLKLFLDARGYGAHTTVTPSGIPLRAST